MVSLRGLHWRTGVAALKPRALAREVIARCEGRRPAPAEALEEPTTRAPTSRHKGPIREAQAFPGLLDSLPGGREEREVEMRQTPSGAFRRADAKYIFCVCGCLFDCRSRWADGAPVGHAPDRRTCQKCPQDSHNHSAWRGHTCVRLGSLLYRAPCGQRAPHGCRAPGRSEVLRGGRLGFKRRCPPFCLALQVRRWSPRGIS